MRMTESSVAKSETAIFKVLWTMGTDGRWRIDGAKGLDLIPKDGFGSDYFSFESEVELLTNHPPKNIHDMLSSFGTTSSLLKQSILPVVAWVDGEDFIRCIGTAFVISCTGYLITASHVLRDAEDEGYGRVTKKDNVLSLDDRVSMGVLIPTSPGYGTRGFRYFSFEKAWYWGEWKRSPLIHEEDRFDYVTDIAVCKISQMPDSAAHQPLNLSLNAFAIGEKAFSIGYAEMENIPIKREGEKITVSDFKQELFVSVGKVMNNFPENHLRKEVRTPGPCFDFDAKIPGKMSGSPIFGANGAVVRGVVSGSWSGEQHAYGAMLGPVLKLPLSGVTTIENMMNSGNEGIAKARGQGL